LFLVVVVVVVVVVVISFLKSNVFSFFQEERIKWAREREEIVKKMQTDYEAKQVCVKSIV
jgi:hypothetical protein